jgi:hypothetical protein
MADKEIVDDHDIELHEDENEIMEAQGTHDPKNAEAQSIVAVDKAGEATGNAPKRKGDNTKQDPMPKTKAGIISAMVGKMQGMDKAGLSAMLKTKIKFMLKLILRMILKHLLMKKQHYLIRLSKKQRLFSKLQLIQK